MKLGDHLISARIGYEHHGIYIGNEQVIHYAGFSTPLDKGRIEITTLDDFCQKSDFKICTHSNPKYNAEERVDRAYSKLYEDEYNLLFNNCEHFVYWCITGEKECKQIQNRVYSVVEFATVLAATRAIIPTAETVINGTTVLHTGSTIASVAKTTAVFTSGAAGAAVASATTTGSLVAGVGFVAASGSAAPIVLTGLVVGCVVSWLWSD